MLRFERVEWRHSERKGLFHERAGRLFPAIADFCVAPGISPGCWGRVGRTGSRLALAQRSGPMRGSSAGPLAAHAPHFPAQAHSVIYLFMHGGPSHLRDIRPQARTPAPGGPAVAGELRAGRHPAQGGAQPAARHPRTFRKCGQSGIEISDFLPHLRECADDLAVIRSCWADSVNHPRPSTR